MPQHMGQKSSDESPQLPEQSPVVTRPQLGQKLFHDRSELPGTSFALGKSLLVGLDVDVP